MCMQLGTGSKVMLAPLLSWWEEPASQNRGWGLVLVSRQIWQSDWLLWRSHRCTRETVSDSSSSSLFVCLLIFRQRNEQNQWWDRCFFSIFFLTKMFFSKSYTFCCKKIKLLCLCLGFKRMQIKRAGDGECTPQRMWKIRPSYLMEVNKYFSYFFTVTLQLCDISKWHKSYLLVNLLRGLIYIYTKTTGLDNCQWWNKENNAAR